MARPAFPARLLVWDGLPGHRSRAVGRSSLETHPESPPATMDSSFGGPNGGLEDQQEVEKVLDFSYIYGIT
jgi:hypothetical protein